MKILSLLFIILSLPLSYLIFSRDTIKRVVTFIFLSSLCFTVGIIYWGEYDIVFPVYIMSNLSAIFLMKKGKSGSISRLSLLFSFFLLFQLIRGIIINTTFNALSVFITYLIFPIIYYLAADSISRANSHIFIPDVRFLSISILLLSTSDMLISSCLFFLGPIHQAIFNHHPIGGGLSISLLPIYIFISKRCKGYDPQLVLYLVSGTISVILSRLRGYELVWFGTLVFLILARWGEHVWNKNNGGHDRKKFLYAFFSCNAITLLALIFFYYSKNILEFLRIYDSLGRRNLENEMIKAIMSNSKLSDFFLGKGIGTVLSDIAPLFSLDIGVDYGINQLIRLGTKYCVHNFWFTIWYSIGTIGIIFYLVFFINIGRDVYENVSGRQKFIYMIYILLLCITLKYRETLFRMTFELITLSISLFLERRYNQQMS